MQIVTNNKQNEKLMRKRTIIIAGITYIFVTLVFGFTNKVEASEPVSMMTENYLNSFQIEVYTNSGKKLGSGFKVNGYEGYIVTNRHVVVDGEEFVTTYLDGKKYYLEVVDVSNNYDLAILKFKFDEPSTGQPLNLCDDSNRSLDYPVYNIGHPSGNRYIFTRGYISGFKRDVPYFKTKSLFIHANLDNIYGGQSGSSLIDTNKHCILGVLTGVGGNNLSYSIEVEALKSYLNAVKILQLSKKIINLAD
tara:strand:- start:242 stop:988 length:747 start_codon:yes stop_codon:yes gene_type:complete